MAITHNLPKPVLTLAGHGVIYDDYDVTKQSHDMLH